MTVSGDFSPTNLLPSIQDSLQPNQDNLQNDESIDILAQEILQSEGAQILPELKDLINRLTVTKSLVQLKYLKTYLEHLHENGAEVFGNALWKIIRVNEEGESILGPIDKGISRSSPALLPILQKISEEKTLLLSWFKFTYGLPETFDIFKIPYELLKKFLLSTFGKAHQVLLCYSMTSEVQANLLYFYQKADNSIELRDINALELLFNDPEFLGMTIDFTEIHPDYLPVLLQLIQAAPEYTKNLLKEGLSSAESGSFLASLTYIFPSNVLDVLQHPNHSPEKLKHLEQQIKQYPLQINLLISLALQEWTHPELDGLTKTIFQEPDSATSILDFLFSFCVEGHLQMSFPIQTLKCLKDLLDRHKSSLPALLDEIKPHAPSVKEKIIEQLHILNQSPVIVEKIIQEKEIILLISILAGFYSEKPVDQAQALVVLDWIKKFPERAKEFSFVLKVFSDSYLTPYQRELITLSLSVVHFPEKLNEILEQYAEMPNTALNMIFMIAVNHSEVRQKLIEIIQEKPKKEKKEKNNFFITLRENEFSSNKYILNSAKLTNEEKSHLIKISLFSGNALAHKLLLFHNKNPDIATKIISFTISYRDSKLSWHLLHTLQAHPQSPLAKLYTQCLLKEDYENLKELAIFSDKALPVDIKRKVKKVLKHTDAELGLVIKELRSLIYAKAASHLAPEKTNPWEENIQALTLQAKDSSPLHEIQQQNLNYWIVQFIADQVISHDGHIDVRIITTILDHLKTANDLTASHYAQIEFILSLITDSPRIVALLEACGNAIPKKSSTLFLIKASLGLSYDAEILPSHIIKMVLITLMQHPRQSALTGSCVGTSQLNALLSNPEKAISLIATIVNQGELKVFHKNIGYSVGFSPRIFDQSLFQPLSLDLPLEDSLSRLPWVERLQTFFNIADQERISWIHKACAFNEQTRKTQAQENSYPLTVKDIIKDLAKSAQSLRPDLNSKENLADLAEIIYLSFFDNLMTHILEGLFINADIYDTKGRLNRAIKRIFFYLDSSARKDGKELDFSDPRDIFLLQNRNEGSPAHYPQALADLCRDLSSDKKDILKKVSQKFQKSIADSIDVSYDFNNFVSKEEFGRLVFTIRSQQEGTPHYLNSQESFTSLLADLAKQCTEAINETSMTADLREWWTEFSKEVTNYINSESFLNGLILLFSGGVPNSFNPIEKKDENLLKTFSPLTLQTNYKNIPWLLKTGAHLGNSMIAMAKLDNANLLRLSLHCKTASDVKDYFLSLLKYLNITTSTAKIYTGGIPRHAINFVFNHPSLQPLINAQDKRAWLEQTCLIPARELNQQVVSKDDYLLICEKVTNSISAHPLQQKWLKLLEKEPASYQIGDVRAHLMMHLKDIFSASNDSNFSPVLDTLLLLKYGAQTPILSIIDTNWYDPKTLENIYLGLIFSPISLEWELWKAQDNKLIEKNESFFSTSDAYELIFTA